MITSEELQQYIDSFHKEKGTYTMDELMRIGVEFKKLPRKQRNWEALHQLLGVYNITPDCYRKRVERYIRNNDIELVEESELETPALPEETSNYKEAFVEKQKIRDWYNAFRRDMREETRIENLKDEIRSAADKFSKFDFKKCINPVVCEGTEAVVLLSDLHIGVDCDNYYNRFNVDIAAERLSKLAENVKYYCELNAVETLHILNLGDLINGIIHTNARIEAQMDVAEQIMCAGELISTFLADILEAAPHITYRSVFDNHSRAIANKNEHIEKEQFSRVIDWFIAERLDGSGIEFLGNEIDGGIGRFKLKSGKTLMFCHGHNDGRNSSYQNFIGLTQEWVDYICMAHYHNSAAKEFQGCRVFINGSVVGTESYAFGRRLFSKPSQKILIFNTSNNNVQDIDASLE